MVNTDGDHQYHGQDIPRLVEPILRGKADFVVGDRDAAASPHFSLQKRFLQGAGSRIVRQLSGTGVPDAPSGFRALSRDAALRLNVVTSYSYTIETLIQAGTQKMAVVSIPIATRSTPRKSRLARGSIDYVLRSAVTVVRAYAMYQPLRLFVMSALLLVIPGLIGALRFVWFYAQGNGSGHVQSLVLSGVLIIIGFQVGLIGLVADLIAANRRLIEESLYRLRRIDARRDPLRPLADADQPEPIPDEKRSNTHV